MDLIQLATSLEDMEEYEALPDGMYPAEVREVEVKHSEALPNGYFLIRLRIDPEDFPADYDVANAPEGVTVTYARVAVPDGQNRRQVGPFKRLLAALGQDMKATEFSPDDWIGKNVQVLLKRSSYQGAETNNVDGISELPSV